MLATCLFCYQPFPENQTLEPFASGRRVAYDPVRGRLWAVCSSCGRWTLAPFETRWEVLEDLERLTRDRARLLGETDCSNWNWRSWSPGGGRRRRSL